MRKASQSANLSKHFMLLEGEPLEAWNSGHRSLPLGFPDGYSFAASGIPPLLDPHYKLEADEKFRALHTLAVHDARQ
jgi:hypothetical protein